MKHSNRPELCGFGAGFPNALQGDLYFSWKLDAGRQAAYRVSVTETGKPVWCCGWTESSRMYGVKCPAEALKEDTAYEARLVLRMEDGRELCAEPVKFWTGISDKSWQSEWLKPYQSELSNYSPLFRKLFRIDKEIRTARLYVCGLGYFMASVNGKAVRLFRDFV